MQLFIVDCSPWNALTVLLMLLLRADDLQMINQGCTMIIAFTTVFDPTLIAPYTCSASAVNFN